MRKVKKNRRRNEESNRSGKIGFNLNQVDTKGATGVNPDILKK